MRKIKTAASIALATATLAQSAPAHPLSSGAILQAPHVGDKPWHWIEVEPARGSDIGWSTFTGVAIVHMSGRHFHADLTIDPGQAGTDITLDGRISGGRIEASEILLNTDGPPASVRGALRLERIGDVVEARIDLHGGQSGIASFLGLYRRTNR